MSLFVSNTYNTRIPYVQQPKKAVVERNLSENIEFAGCNLSESQGKALINEDEQKQQKKKKIRNILIGVGAAIALGAVAFGAYRLIKNSPKNIMKKLADISDFDKFKNFKMTAGMSLHDKKKCFDIINNFGNKNVFYATLAGNKPTALLSSNKSMEVLSKLKLGKNLEFIFTEPIKIGDMSFYHSYLVNKKSLTKIIKNNYDIFASRLSVSGKPEVKELLLRAMEALKTSGGLGTKTLLDIEGLCLGFPKYSTMIFNLEQAAGIANLRGSIPEFKTKLLEVLKRSDSPYKNLDRKSFSGLERAIKNISDEKLKNINKNGSFNNDIYEFIQFLNEPKELKRINKASETFGKQLCKTPFLRTA